MNSKQEILDRVTLLMGYDSSKTLNENKRDLYLIIEGPGGAIAKDLETVFKGIEAGTRDMTAFKNAVKDVQGIGKIGVNNALLKTDGTIFRYNPANAEAELYAALENKILSQETLGRIRTQMLKRGYLEPATRAILIKDLINYKEFINKYKGLTANEIKQKLIKSKYTSEQADEITNAYVKERGYDKPPTTTEEIAAANQAAAKAKAEREAADAVVGKKGETIGKTEAEIAAAKEGERIAALVKETEAANHITYNINGNTGVVNITNNITMGRKTLADSGPGAIEAETKRILGDITPVTNPSILKRFDKGFKVYFLKKLATWLGIGAAIGVAYIIIRRELGTDKVALLKPNGDVYGGDGEEGDPSGYDSTWANPGGYTGTNDMSAANAAAAEAAAAEAERQRLASQQQAPSSLSMSNIANSFDKTIPAAQTLSPEEKDHLINNIRNGKRYVGADLNPAQRAFVDQYMKNIESRLPSKEKTKYIKNEPVRQNIKYGKKI